MSDDLVYVPGEDDSFVALSRTKSGKLFRKHILSKGTLFYPGIKGGKVEITDEFLAKLSENFEKKVTPIVQTPVVGDNNAHSEDPFRNIGEVVGLEVEDGKAYAVIDARDEVAAQKLGKTLLGASAMLSLDYTDTRTNTKAGPTLLHVAITNRPHLTDLDDFQEVIAASASDSSSKAVVLTAAKTTKENPMMDLDELIAVARDEHGIDIPELQQAAARAGDFAKLSAELQDKLSNSGVLKLSADDASGTEDIVAAVASIVDTNVELSAKVDTLVQDAATAKAEKRVDELVASGFITPAKRDSSLKLLLSNAELFDELLPEKPIVELSAEKGQEFKEETHDEVVVGEVARLSALGEAAGLTVKA
jgi:hypothetical protein